MNCINRIKGLQKSAQKQRRGERGSALLEGAILIPVLILLIYWSSAMTDVTILTIKKSEATRFALWEMTIFRSKANIATDVQTRFADLKSGAKVHSTSTGLLMYPQSSQMTWTTNINPNNARVALNGEVRLPTTGLGFIQDAANTLLNFLSSIVDGAVQSEQFNVYGSASAQVSLTRSSHAGSIILNGGDLAGHLSGGQDLAAGNNNMLDFTLRPLPGEHPMLLVYDSWKAWPKPAVYTTTTSTPASLEDPTISPMNTYPVVESMVSNQVNKIAFFGMGQLGFLDTINNAIGTIFSSGISQTIFGGNMPEVFSTNPMDHGLADVGTGEHTGNVGFSRGPVTILPVGPPDVGFVPGAGLFTNRLGDLGTSNTSTQTIDDYSGMGAGSDVSRYTVPYRINTRYWTSQLLTPNDGGTNNTTFGAQVSNPPTQMTNNNYYVQAYACRGHYFAGATKPQIADPTQRYKFACPN